MHLDFTAEQDELRAAVRAVLERECPIAAVRRWVDSDEPVELWSTVVALDWPALTVAAELGGIGLGYVELAVVAEELGRALAPGPFAPTVSQFVPAVAGAPELLKSVAAGQLTGTLAWLDDDAVPLRAEPSGDGGFLLEGRRRWVVEAAVVDELAVPVGDDTVVVVPASDVSIEPVRTFDLTRRLAHVTFDGVRVAPERVVRSPVGDALEQATVAVALDMVGACQKILDTVLTYARERHQFGVPIGSFQAVKHKLANMYVALERARATCYFAAACIAEDDGRRALATSMAKAAAGDAQRLVAADGIQLLGGIGYTWEHDQHLYVKRAKADELLFGTAAEHRARVADLIGI